MSSARTSSDGNQYPLSIHCANVKVLDVFIEKKSIDFKILRNRRARTAAFALLFCGRVIRLLQATDQLLAIAGGQRLHRQRDLALDNFNGG